MAVRHFINADGSIVTLNVKRSFKLEGYGRVLPLSHRKALTPDEILIHHLTQRERAEAKEYVRQLAENRELEEMRRKAMRAAIEADMENRPLPTPPDRSPNIHPPGYYSTNTNAANRDFPILSFFKILMLLYMVLSFFASLSNR